MICNGCAKNNVCIFPWKGKMTGAGSCSQFSKGEKFISVCHYCNKPNPEDVNGPSFTFQSWEIHDKEKNEHIYRVVCKECYDKTIQGFKGIYI